MQWARREKRAGGRRWKNPNHIGLCELNKVGTRGFLPVDMHSH